MAYHEHLREFAGLPVLRFPSLNETAHLRTLEHVNAERLGREAEEVPDPNPLPAAALNDPGSVAWRLCDVGESCMCWREPCVCEDGETPEEYLDRFVAEVEAARVTAVTVGALGYDDIGESTEASRDMIIDRAAHLPNLRSLFFTEFTLGESELSWIIQCDLAPLLAAFPQLTELVVRGSGHLALHVPEHQSLRRLTVQSAGLPGEVCRQIAASGLPALEHLELIIGMEDYGGDAGPEDLEPVLSGRAFPRLRSLGLRSTDRTHEWIRALAEAPVTRSLRTLDLSLGGLTDEGARTLLGTPVFRELERLDLCRHELSPEVADELQREFARAGVDVDLRNEGDKEESEEWDARYPSIVE